MSKYTTLILLAIILAIVLIIGLYLFTMPQPSIQPINTTGAITNFDDCLATGQPILESYPRQCQANGQTYVEDIGNTLAKVDLIRLDQPMPNQIISSPLTITGQARGIWYFEASFPIKLLDGNGQEIAIAIAQAQGEWMTEEFVPFTAQITFTKPSTAKGTLILEKDNPSDLPANSDQLSVPIKF